jgi:hypothetical protein
MHRYFHVSDYVAYADVEAACTEKCPIRFGIFFQREFHQIHFANARLLEIYWGFFFRHNQDPLLRRFVLLEARVHTRNSLGFRCYDGFLQVRTKLIF